MCTAAQQDHKIPLKKGSKRPTILWLWLTDLWWALLSAVERLATLLIEAAGVRTAADCFALSSCCYASLTTAVVLGLKRSERCQLSFTFAANIRGEIPLCADQTWALICWYQNVWCAHEEDPFGLLFCFQGIQAKIAFWNTMLLVSLLSLVRTSGLGLHLSHQSC